MFDLLFGWALASYAAPAAASSDPAMEKKDISLLVFFSFSFLFQSRGHFSLSSSSYELLLGNRLTSYYTIPNYYTT